MKNKFLFYFICLSVISCNSQVSKEVLSKSLDKLIYNTQDTGYSYYDDNYLFIEKKDSIIVTNAFKIRGLYYNENFLKERGSLTLKEFMKGLLEDKKEIPIEYKISCFVIDNNIRREYIELGFEIFKKKYVNRFLSDNKVVLSLSGLEPQNEFYSIIYYFYINGYFTFWADYEGCYFSVKILEEEIPISDSLDIILEEI